VVQPASAPTEMTIAASAAQIARTTINVMRRGRAAAGRGRHPGRGDRPSEGPGLDGESDRPER
jgi:hypothetical protein